MRYSIFAVILLVLMTASTWFAIIYKHSLQDPVIITDNITVEIDKGDSLNIIADKLIAQDLAINPLIFKLMVLQKEVATQLKSGEYELTIGLTLPDIIDLFVQGKSKQYSITFVEGLRFEELLQTLQKNNFIVHTLNISMRIPDFMRSLHATYQNPEGLFFPDTYFFTKNTTDTALLTRAYEKMQAVLLEEWLHRSNNIVIKTPYEALILASIIEKETAKENERALISGVFQRRLKQNMLLQTDPTVIYGMGANYYGNIRSQDLITPTPYNTYLNKGLPPTPIAMPSKAALHAALNPANGDALYFVARGDGTHHFSNTLNTHNQAVNQFQLEKKIEKKVILKLRKMPKVIHKKTFKARHKKR